MYTDENLLMLSGIQHVVFCARQWALIHIEQQWSENMLTAEGRILHERVDNPLESESRGNRQFLRSVHLVSYELGLYGRADLVELNLVESGSRQNSIQVKGKPGYWKIVPVEYKRGKPKSIDCDRVQLCAQAMCLEEMHKVSLAEGFLYYGQPHKRYPVLLDDELRNQTKNYALKMHGLFNKAITPPPVYKKHCHSCSMYEVCQPKVIANRSNVNEYLNKMIIDDQ